MLNFCRSHSWRFLGSWRCRHPKSAPHRPADHYRSASPILTAGTCCLPPHFPQRHKVCFVNFRIWQAMRVLIHTHISCRLLVEGSAPKPLLNTEFHSVVARSANALKWYAKAPFPFRCPGTNRPPYCLMAAVKHSSPRLMCGQNAYLSFSFTPHPVFCFFAWCVVKRDILWWFWGTLKWGPFGIMGWQNTTPSEILFSWISLPKLPSAIPFARKKQERATLLSLQT